MHLLSVQPTIPRTASAPPAFHNVAAAKAHRAPDAGKPFRLQLRRDSQGRERLTLFHGGQDDDEVKILMPDGIKRPLLQPTLRLLRYLAKHSPKPLSTASLHDALPVCFGSPWWSLYS